MKYGLTSIDNIPYLNKTQLEGRFVNTVFYDDDQWHMYTNTSSGLIKMHVIDAKETIYFAKEPALDTDFYYYTLDFLSQHANYMFIRKSFKGLTDDIYNLSTSLYKIRFFENSDALVGYQQVIITELEYFFIVCRSLFDLMQDVISQLWHNISLSDTTIRKSEIPKSFNSMLKC
ncbi:hypothetical protein ADMFC3_23590 [Geovibrio sp. ADMFC3]